MDKTLSIIIPCYNVEKYIEECLESVCNDRDADIEVICVNDGSTDGTLDILEQWKQKDARVIVINQENKGVSVARNQGKYGDLAMSSRNRAYTLSLRMGDSGFS